MLWSFEINTLSLHSSEIRGLCLMKLSTVYMVWYFKIRFIFGVTNSNFFNINIRANSKLLKMKRFRKTNLSSIKLLYLKSVCSHAATQISWHLATRCIFVHLTKEIVQSPRCPFNHTMWIKMHDFFKNVSYV